MSSIISSTSVRHKIWVLIAIVIHLASSSQAQGIKGGQQPLTRPHQQQQFKRPSFVTNNQQVANAPVAPASSLYGGNTDSPTQKPGSISLPISARPRDQSYDSGDFGPSSATDSGYGTSNQDSSQQDSEADSEPALYGSVAGKPGVDFPAFTRVPKTSFTCEGKGFDFGYYADEETGCQAYHVCWSGRRESFLCGVGTVFNQAILACDYWHSVDCSKSSQFYGVNSELGKSSAEPGTQQLQQARAPSNTQSSGLANNNNGYDSGSRSPSSPAMIGQQQQQQQQYNNNNYSPRAPASSSPAAATSGIYNNAQSNTNQPQQQTFARTTGKTSNNNNFGSVFRPAQSPVQQQRQQQQYQYGTRPKSVTAPTPRPFGQAQRGGVYPQQQQQQPRVTTTGYQQDDVQQQQQLPNSLDSQSQQQVDHQSNSNFDDAPVQTTTLQSPLSGANNFNSGARPYNSNPASSSAITTQYDTMISNNNNNQQLGHTFEQLEEQQQRQSEEGLLGARAAASNNRNWYIMRPIESH